MNTDRFTDADSIDEGVYADGVVEASVPEGFCDVKDADKIIEKEFGDESAMRSRQQLRDAGTEFLKNHGLDENGNPLRSIS